MRMFAASVRMFAASALEQAQHMVGGFRQGLNEAGFIEGQNVVIEFSSADGHLDRLPALIADLIRRPVAVIVANGSAAKVAKTATKTIPIIFAFGGTQSERVSLPASTVRMATSLA
jgi:putative ABC transport system substrate-binding protein